MWVKLGHRGKREHGVDRRTARPKTNRQWCKEYGDGVECRFGLSFCHCINYRQYSIVFLLVKT